MTIPWLQLELCIMCTEPFYHNVKNHAWITSFTACWELVRTALHAALLNPGGEMSRATTNDYPHYALIMYLDWDSLNVKSGQTNAGANAMVTATHCIDLFH